MRLEIGIHAFLPHDLEGFGAFLKRDPSDPDALPGGLDVFAATDQWWSVPDPPSPAALEAIRRSLAPVPGGAPPKGAPFPQAPPRHPDP